MALAMKLTHVAIGIVIRDQLVLICRRRAIDSLAGYWEFPGGKVEPGESPEDCLHRELAEELGIKVSIRKAIEPFIYTYPHMKVYLLPFICDHMEGEACPLAADELKWIRPAELANYRFPPANDDLLSILRQTLP
jgi:8-oxo-dGTP diphosphatase